MVGTWLTLQRPPGAVDVTPAKLEEGLVAAFVTAGRVSPPRDAKTPDKSPPRGGARSCDSPSLAARADDAVLLVEAYMDGLRGRIRASRVINAALGQAGESAFHHSTFNAETRQRPRVHRRRRIGSVLQDRDW